MRLERKTQTLTENPDHSPTYITWNPPAIAGGRRLRMIPRLRFLNKWYAVTRLRYENIFQDFKELVKGKH